MVELIKSVPGRFEELKKEHGAWSARSKALEEAVVDAINKATTIEDIKSILLTIYIGSE